MFVWASQKDCTLVRLYGVAERLIKANCIFSNQTMVYNSYLDSYFGISRVFGIRLKFYIVYIN